MMDSISAELYDPAQQKKPTDEVANSPQKALGIVWNASNDCMYVSAGNPSTQPPYGF